MKALLLEACAEYIESTSHIPNRIRCNWATAAKIKSATDLHFEIRPDFQILVDGLLFEIDDEIAPDIVVVDRK